jgi:hypothetical protein
MFINAEQPFFSFFFLSDEFEFFLHPYGFYNNALGDEYEKYCVETYTMREIFRLVGNTQK